MNSITATADRKGERSNNAKVVLRRTPVRVNVEVGTGAIAPKVAIVRRKAQPRVNVEVGTGAIAPKVAIARGKTGSMR